ncbi:MAG: AraC family transcriptional regulator [Clostridia bacterium]|nr:AraC family transcriptional regulator [Clostridia bacterium]
MQLFSQRCENEIMNVVHSAIFFSENNNFFGALDDTADLTDSRTVFSIKNSILNFEEANPVVCNVAIINRNNEMVFSSEGLLTFNEYFNGILSYNNYNKDYWKNYRPFVSSQYTILSPSGFSCRNKDGAVFPVIIFENNNKRFKNLLVVNISIDTLISMQNNYLANEDTKIFLMNNHSGDIFYNSESTTVTENILNSDLYSSLLNEKFFKQNISELGKCFIAAYSTRNNLNGYTYFGAIPCGSIYKIQFTDILIFIFLFLFLVAVSVSYSINSANKILNPIRRTIEAISQQNVLSDNIFESLELATANISKTNKELFTTLPYAQEKYLINFLNSTDYLVAEETKEIIKNSLPFRHEYFASVILQIYPTKLFFETYSQTEYLNILSGLYSLIRLMFSEKYQSFFLTSDKDTIYIILNTENDDVKEDIKNTISEINGLLKYDNGYFNIYVGLGGIYKDWDGLKKAHLEAMSDLKYMQQDSLKIIINSNESLNDAEISQLYNVLMAYDINQAKRLIDEYSLKAKGDQRLLKQLYTQILTTIFRVMRMRNISYNDNQLDFEVYSNILVKSCMEIYKEIVLLLNAISNAKNAEIPVNLGEEIIDYINNNFTDQSLSLDVLAERFKVQPTYISTIIKNALGVGFHQHLTTLRVSKAKELLANAGMSIQEIYESCGFYSKSTFFRVFKKNTGVTPNDYRKIHID